MTNPFDLKDIDIFSVRCSRVPPSRRNRTLHYDFRLKEKSMKHYKPNTQYNCVVKVSYTSPKNLGSHLSYIMREGAGKDSAKAILFDENGTYVKAGHYTKANRLPGEKRIFKLIVTPESGVSIHDLHAFAKRVMRKVENEQGQRLNWVAAAHYNTGNPHIHIVVRGIDKDGRDVRLKKQLIRSGIRNIAKNDIAVNYGEKSFYQAHSDELKQTHSPNITKFDRVIAKKIENRPQHFGYVSYLPDNEMEYSRLLYLEKLGYAKKTFVSGYNFAQKGFLVNRNFFEKIQTRQIDRDILKTTYRKKEPEKEKQTPAVTRSVPVQKPQQPQKNVFEQRNLRKLRMMGQ